MGKKAAKKKVIIKEESEDEISDSSEQVEETTLIKISEENHSAIDEYVILSINRLKEKNNQPSDKELLTCLGPTIPLLEKEK